MHAMAAVAVHAILCYDRVNYVIMSLLWFSLIGQLGPIAVLLTYLQTMIFQRTGFGETTSFLDERKLETYLIGLGQGSRGAPPS